jgi:hypothetical protein
MCPTLVAPAAALLRSDWPLLRIADVLTDSILSSTPHHNMIELINKGNLELLRPDQLSQLFLRRAHILYPVMISLKRWHIGDHAKSLKLTGNVEGTYRALPLLSNEKLRRI